MTALLLKTVFFFALATSLLLNRLAKRNRLQVEGGDNRKLRLGPDYGRRGDYNDRGWLYRNLTVLSQIVAIAAMLLWWLTLPR